MEAVKDLLGKGADINAQNDKGETPFDLATDDKIKTLLQPTEKSDPVDESSTDSKGGQEGDAQTEEQQSSFFGSLFSILMKPFSLIASFFGGFFSWLFGSNEEKIDESTSQTDASVSLPKLDSLDEEDNSGGHYSLINTDM